MVSILLAPMPFTGHVSPVLAVASALVLQGHHVRVYTGRAFQGAVERTGAKFVPWTLAPNFDEQNLVATFPRLVGQKGIRQVFLNIEDVFIHTSPAQVADLEAEWARQPWQVSAGDEMSIGTAMFAEKYGCRHATIAVLPLNIARDQGPPSGLGLTPGVTALVQLRDAVFRTAVPLMSQPLDVPLRRARAAVGLAPSARSFFTSAFSHELVAVSGCPALDFDRTDLPPHVQFVGRLAAAAAPMPLPDWWGDLDGQEVVYVTQGTQNTDPSDLLHPTLAALASENVLVVATTGIRGVTSLPFEVPPNARVTDLLPYAELLPRVHVMVTNGGWGGTLASLSHGIPLVIAGGDLDKPEVAARAAWSGAGLNLRTGTPSATQIARAVGRVRADQQMRTAAVRVQQQLQELGGAARAAELIVELGG